MVVLGMDVCREVVALHDPAAHPAVLHRSVGPSDLQVVLHGAPLTAEVDPDLLGSAIGNLLSNAIRFSPRGATIRIELHRAASTLLIDVADAGPGVPESDRSHVFEPFYRGSLQPEEGLPGTGIGLSIVAQTVQAHGGSVRLLPATPGAHFRLELPHALPD